jgi:hypothetical protein
MGLSFGEALSRVREIEERKRAEQYRTIVITQTKED